MTSSYAKVRKELAAQTVGDMPADPSLEPMPCPRCSGMTTRGALSNYGARCFRCYEAYCRDPFVQREPSTYANRP